MTGSRCPSCHHDRTTVQSYTVARPHQQPNVLADVSCDLCLHWWQALTTREWAERTVRRSIKMNRKVGLSHETAEAHDRGRGLPDGTSH